jgi:hypothetical protein
MSSRYPRRSLAILIFAALLLPVGAAQATPVAHGGRLSALASTALHNPLIQFLINLVIDAGSGADGNG